MDELFKEALTLWNLSNTVLSVTSSFIILRYHVTLSPTALLGVFTMGVISTAYLVLGQIKFGEVYSSSRKFRETWIRNHDIPRHDRILLRKYLKGCRPLRYKTASFGFHQKSNLMRVIGRIVFYTTKLLILTR